MAIDFENPEPEEEEVPSQTWRFWDLVLIGLAAGVIFVLGLLALRFIPGVWESMVSGTGGNTILLSALMAALEGIALIGGVWLAGLKRRRLSWSAVGVRQMSLTWWAIAGGIGLAIIPLSALIVAILQLIIGGEFKNPQIPFLAPEGFSWSGLISMLILVGLVAPFAEELVFRGVFYKWLRDRWGVWVGVFISALVFGAAHVVPSVAAVAFVLGLILAYSYERSGSLWAPVLIHVINNAVKVLALYALLGSGLIPPGGI